MSIFLRHWPDALRPSERQHSVPHGKLVAYKSTFYCATIAYHVRLNALLVAARHHDQRLRKKDVYTWP